MDFANGSNDDDQLTGVRESLTDVGELMSGIWGLGNEGQWRPLTSAGFALEADLHDLIEQTPAMLPLAGVPRLAVVGREVRCGPERADLLAVEVETGRPVVIEVKLAANTDRRRSLTQVLGYAAYLRRLDSEGLFILLQDYLERHGYSSIADAAGAATEGDPNFDEDSFNVRLNEALSDGRLRAVVVLDEAPADLVDLVGYLQDVTSDRLALDLVVVTAYEVAGQRLLVPQLVEPDRTQLTAESAGTGKPSSASEILLGSDEFEGSIGTVAAEQQPSLRRLLEWAQGLQNDRLATLYTSIGKGRWVLNPRLPGQSRAMVSIWNDKGAYLSPYRTVFEQEAPTTLAKLDNVAPNEIGRGNYIHAQLDDALLGLLREAYVESRNRRHQAASPSSSA
ncbi:hypothetical protein EV645_1984 [Kribbella rubisoli]|uniref:DUF91 domain-containing protein n=1 Tax=Kribbella rubisoli TaxID=3075929 RepID=A0A4V2FZ23_9ACTN|nr:hypothetical protein [Kribbella rubisoli]RZU19766.1 hypothetical protein EV645_1984 [Kribbella rubisoli]